MGSPLPCSIQSTGNMVRATVGPGDAAEIQDCYRAIAVFCIQSQVRCALVVSGDGEATDHLALKDGMSCVAMAGLPQDFRLALVATPETQAVYALAEEAARHSGIKAKLFQTEEEAVSWLNE